MNEQPLERQGAGPEPDDSLPEGWSRPLPRVLPRPTYRPATLAFGATLVGFGVLTSYLVSVVGALIFVIAVVGWLGELRHERAE